ncbi:hypothetical protein YPPY34_4835, partial [Yersinia pestis PY-34]
MFPRPRGDKGIFCAHAKSSGLSCHPPFRGNGRG